MFSVTNNGHFFSPTFPLKKLKSFTSVLRFGGCDNHFFFPGVNIVCSSYVSVTLGFCQQRWPAPSRLPPDRESIAAKGIYVFTCVAFVFFPSAILRFYNMPVTPEFPLSNQPIARLEAHTGKNSALTMTLLESATITVRTLEMMASSIQIPFLQPIVTGSLLIFEGLNVSFKICLPSQSKCQCRQPNPTPPRKLISGSWT